MTILGLALDATTIALPDGSTWPRDTLRPALERRQTRDRRVSVALMPAVAPLRTIRLPKMRDREALAVVSRAIGRYVPGIREAQLVALERVGPAEEGANEYLYAVSCVPTALVDAIERDVQAAGWTLVGLTPAYAAWASLGRAVVTVARDDLTDTFRVLRGVPYDLRRARSSADTALIGDAAPRAALLAPRAKRLSFRTPTASRQQSRHRSRQLGGVAAAALVLGAVTLGALWWQAQAALRRADAARAAIAPRVAAVMRSQSAWIALNNPAQALARVEEHGVRWSVVLADLADRLPDDAHIESLRGTSDSVSIDAAAGNGAHAVGAVVKSTALVGAGPSGPIRRDVPMDSSSALERFTLTARILNAAPLVPPPSRKPVARP